MKYVLAHARVQCLISRKEEAFRADDRFIASAAAGYQNKTAIVFSPIIYLLRHTEYSAWDRTMIAD